jgi:FkbM family methyltransferase
MASAEDLTRIEKFRALTATVENWPLAALDKLGFVRTCRYRLRSGYDMECRPQSTDINEVVAIASGIEYPPAYLRLADRDSIVDLGANIGSFAVYLDAINRGKEYSGLAVEPLGANFQLLTRNLERNRLTSRFRAVNAAVGGHDGWGSLEGIDRYDSAYLTDNRSGDVRVCKLSSLCRELAISRIDLLKMDIEGAEYLVLESDRAFLIESVDRILLEYHELSDDRNLAYIRRLLESDFVLDVVHSGTRTGVVCASNRHRAPER